MTTFIDADGHVEESTAMFSRLEEEYYPPETRGPGRVPICYAYDYGAGKA